MNSVFPPFASLKPSISPDNSPRVYYLLVYWPKMPKKGKKAESAGECKVPSRQEKGNQAYLQGDFERAAVMYSRGLEVEPKNAILLSNRAAALIALHRGEEALQDASRAIESDPGYYKAYFRKADALRSVDRIAEALEVVNSTISLLGSKPELATLQTELERELKVELTVPLDHPERVRFNELESWLKSGGAAFPKLKMRFYSVDYRGVHSTTFIPV